MTSTIQITYDGVDITNSVMFASASFEAQLAAIPGQFSLSVKDPYQTLTFITGKEITCTVDGVLLYGGYLTMVSREFAFPVVDTVDTLPANVTTRLWRLSGVDYNILFQKRYLIDPAHPTTLLPGQPVNSYDKELIETLVANYLTFADGFDLTSKVERFRQPIQLVDQLGFGEAAAAAAGLPPPIVKDYQYQSPGSSWKTEMDQLSLQCGTIYYINADKQLIYRAIENSEAKWGFSDIPNSMPVTTFPAWSDSLNTGMSSSGTSMVVGSSTGSPSVPFRIVVPNDIDGFELMMVTAKAGNTFTVSRAIEGSQVDTHASGTQVTALQGFQGATYGFREIEVTEDASNVVNDALVWGGSEFTDPSGGTVFAEAINAESISKHGRWEFGLVDFGQNHTQAFTEFHANQIVSGAANSVDPGNGRGLVFPQWQVRLAWFNEDVPQISGQRDHLKPGDLVTIHLRVMKDAGWPQGLTVLLPLRQVNVSFPTLKDGLPYVRFEGVFGLQASDPWTFWRYLIGRQSTIGNGPVVVTANNDSTVTAYGAQGKFTLTPLPDGVTTVFHLPNNFGYIAGTEEVFINGLFQIPGEIYQNTGSGVGTVTFLSAPVTGDDLFITCWMTGT